MSDVIQVLQLGNKDWSKIYQIPEYIKFHYVDELKEIPRSPYDLVFIDRLLLSGEAALLHKATKAHCLYVDADIVMTEEMEHYYACKVGKRISSIEIQQFLLTEARNYFPKPYGEKFKLTNLSIAQGFLGTVSWEGNYSVNLDGEYGEEYEQIAFWRNNIPVFQGQAIDFWLEYNCDPGVEVALKVVQFRSGSISTIQQEWVFSEDEVNQMMTVDNQLPSGPIFVFLMAKGKGKLNIIALHDRYSRRGHGMFLPGGQRHVTSEREEIFYYFDPGDMKPPLNVYFSGYKTMQGFEGYYMMRKMGCPFLLIAEPRLEGGSFYMGSKEYETALKDIIESHMKQLGFTNQQVILSGLSMGTYGALYYGCDIRPHAMILGKPLASIGDVASNERLHRPGGFPTSLDVLNYLYKNTDEQAVEELNNRFWDKFDKTDWRHSKFVISYMIEDDYDMTAYERLITHLKAEGVELYGKGIHGRHNDATGPIAGWFKSQYENILIQDFSRRIE